MRWLLRWWRLYRAVRRGMLDRRAEACYQGYVASVRVWADCTWGGSDGQRFEPPEVVERHRRNIAPMYDQYVEARIKAWMAR